ncbi:hypothetical protein OGAPHI_002840 [Ogataea philodendri]|uniref:Uncharacterized protein n=1 Tax=Ogataea philodendri TaxID=1378263 RepID=A0A9P8T6R7_9ASCO|nr:uncharacterized protein OGAPHI_002840 [Ogataea philodendri]KAH3667191.1 hypothetical protein OGAPHI_002840 [Ogataea philodendri]
MLLQSKKQKLNKAKKQQQELSASSGNEIAQEGTNSSIGLIRKSESILSPHLSIFQALQNPELELDMSALDTGTERRIPTPINTNPDFSTYNSFYRNEDFSITSWQSIPSGFGLADQNAPPPSRALRSPAKLNSPNIGSILSSSDNEEHRLEDVPVQSSNHEVIIFDSESFSESSDDDTIDSSTVVPSFVMPRVSVPSLANSSSVLQNAIRVQVIGHQREILLSRLAKYRKTLNRTVFTDVDPSFMVAIVNDDNYLLPTLIDKPFIPILTGNSNADSSLLRKSVSKNLMICEPIRMQTINDNLMPLIEFLSNLQVSGGDFGKVIELSASQYAMTNQPLSLESVNSVLLDKSARKLRRSSLHKELDDSNKNNGYPKNYKQGLLFGITVGMVGLVVVLVWKEFAPSPVPDKLENPSRMNKILFRPKEVLQSDCKSDEFDLQGIPHAMAAFCESAVKGSVEALEFVKTDLEALGKMLASSSFFLIERTKLTLLRLIEMTGEVLSW